MAGKSFAGFLMLAVAWAATPSDAKESLKLNLLTAWSATGGGVPSADGSMLFVGVIKGVVYAEKGERFLNAASLLCTITIRIDRDRSIRGKGNCVFTTPNGKLFTRYECKGVRGIGCQGQMTVAGGRGRFKGANGGGYFFFRSGLQNLFKDGNGLVVANSMGLAGWEGLTIRIP